MIHLDDIQVSSNTTKEHHVKQVLKPMSEYNLYVKGEKCEFDVDIVEFLGNCKGGPLRDGREGDSGVEGDRSTVCNG